MSRPDDDFSLELGEWKEALDSVYTRHGAFGVRELLRAVQNHALSRDVRLSEATLNTPYRNTIPPAEEPVYPGDLEIEASLERWMRWNAAAMVARASDRGAGVGGHIATYASAATMLETGFHHIFRARDEKYGGDLIIPQPHAAPGIYARAFLEGRLSADQLDAFRQQLAPGGLPAYPHPRAMPEFWQVPCASMGLSTPTAIYQARFAKYLENRSLKAKNGGRVWCFIGDGEADEPEVLGTVNIAAREKLDNLIVVVNCNLQRLDGPVRGNGKIIQELERSFRGADWNVLKVIWGSGWDGLLARDHEGVLQQRMEQAVDGDYQYLSVSSGEMQREIWVENNPPLRALMSTLTDQEVRDIKRGGQDPKKIYAAYLRALEPTGRPTVILIKSVKGHAPGFGLGQNTAHQKKQLSLEEREALAEECRIPLDKAAIARADYYRPPDDAPEMRYLQARRAELGGYLPRRKVVCPRLPAPKPALFAELREAQTRPMSTTAACVRMLGKLLRDPKLGPYVVPIVPDEARTFGLEGLFPQAGIYSAEGQRYTPVDAGSLLPYKEKTDGQILQEGICETGAMASFLAAGTAAAVHGVPTIPFYMFYSMFGFQRVGDMIWASADMFCRGFLLGGTAGRTTLNGEGLQHQDGHSQVAAGQLPNMRSYDPAFAYELEVIIRDGIRRMRTEDEDCFYYITLYNEAYPMPAAPKESKLEEGILRGIYRVKRAAKKAPAEAQLLASGPLVNQALAARELLAEQGIAASVWSVTSFNELRRDALGCTRHNRLHPEKPAQVPYVQQVLGKEKGVFVAVSDYVKALPDGIATWIPGRYTTLGTDGFGLSETREHLRDHFEVSPGHIALAAASALAEDGALTGKQVAQMRRKFKVTAGKVDPVSL